MTEPLLLRFPRGIKDGQSLRLAGQGDLTASGQRGSLIVKIAVQPHPNFKRENLDLVTQVTVPFTRAALGGKVRVPTLKGDIDLKIPAGTQPDQQLRVPRGRCCRLVEAQRRSTRPSQNRNPTFIDKKTEGIIKRTREKLIIQ